MSFFADESLLFSGCSRLADRLFAPAGLDFRTDDAENRLVRMETKANQIAPVGKIPQSEARRLDFTYDYLGRRVEKLVSSGFNGTSYATTTRTRFIYQGWNLIAEYAVAGSGAGVTFSLQRHYTWGLDLAGPGQRAGGIGALQLIVEANGTQRLSLFGGNVMALV